MRRVARSFSAAVAIHCVAPAAVTSCRFKLPVTWHRAWAVGAHRTPLACAITSSRGRFILNRSQIYDVAVGCEHICTKRPSHFPLCGSLPGRDPPIAVRAATVRDRPPAALSTIVALHLRVRVLDNKGAASQLSGIQSFSGIKKAGILGVCTVS